MTITRTRAVMAETSKFYTGITLGKLGNTLWTMIATGSIILTMVRSERLLLMMGLKYGLAILPSKRRKRQVKQKARLMLLMMLQKLPNKRARG